MPGKIESGGRQTVLGCGDAGRMNGVQLTVEARRIRPDLNVLLASRYATSALDVASVPEDVPLIRK